MKTLAALLLSVLLLPSPALAAEHPFIRPDFSAVTSATVTLPSGEAIDIPALRVVSAPPAWLYGTLSGAMWAAAFWDLDTTQRGLATGLFEEGNPIVAREDGSLNVPVKLALNGVVQAGSLYLWKRGDKWTAVLVVAVGVAVQALVAARNERLLLETSRPANFSPRKLLTNP
jgi:hypothetical protein